MCLGRVEGKCKLHMEAYSEQTNEVGNKENVSSECFQYCMHLTLFHFFKFSSSSATPMSNHMGK